MVTHNKQNVWRGVLIEEAFADDTILDYVEILRTDAAKLEGEEDKGAFHFHKIAIPDEQLSRVIEFARHSIKKGWYFHLVKYDQMKVIFAGKVFEITKGNKHQFDNVRKYGMSLGILEGQLSLERLMDNPYDE